MTCDHSAGLDVRSELVLELDDVSGQDAHNYILDVQAVACRGCGGEFSIGAARGIALRLTPPAAIAPMPVTAAAITADDFEFVG